MTSTGDSVAAGVATVGPMTEADAATFATAVGELSSAVSTFIRGKDDVITLALTCMLAEGHLLLEDVPGVGKTSLARSLAGAMGVPWQRIQFTPDLLPGDVTGVSVYHQDTHEFVFHPGPVFANVVLADEVNRASPRTQSALLEVMEERTVTVDGRSTPVPSPFLVLATQNPVEMDGTYPLPEAQLDRFLMRTRMGYPDRAAEVEVLQSEHHGVAIDAVPRVSSPDVVAGLIATARRTHLDDAVTGYIVDLVTHTRSMPQLRLGASPRGALGLQRAARVRAALQGRPFVVPSDVRALAEPVLAHRLLLSPSFEASGGTGAEAVAEAVAAVPSPPGDGRL